VQTWLQLLQSDATRSGLLPIGCIVDWPDYEIRCIHWDTKHHHDRMETLRRHLDQAAGFKINAVLYELEDKFAYPSHPVIGAPGAWSTEELQSLVDYARERHIEIIPDMQAPAHMTYVLKHSEFSHLRCDGNNYQICMDDPAARKLIFELYDDLCAATRGSKYFHVSTDEVYYAGICERYRKPYNPENRSLAWVDYVNAAHEHLSARGRRVIVWAEFPLLAEHVHLLPPDVINGIGPGRPEMLKATRERGIRNFLYTSMQGEELFFPDLFPYTTQDGSSKPGRLADAACSTAAGTATIPQCLGTIAASWDDAGVHNETFWLGWAVMAQGSWTPGAPLSETISRFMEIFHGSECVNMESIYRGLQSSARFIEYALERLPSVVRGPGYGNSRGKRASPRSDFGMITPVLPDATTFAAEPVFRPRYARILEAVPARLKDHVRVQSLLTENLKRARRNRQALEIFDSIAALQRHMLEMMRDAALAEDRVVEAAACARQGVWDRAHDLIEQAIAQVRHIQTDREAVFERLQTVWERGRFPKGQSVGGKNFVHVMDDVKDHFADRTPDLRYLLAPELRIGLDSWADSLEEFLNILKKSRL